ncbi:hypothetical protein LUTEI9C_100052 [Luteimonas sp. 9C]|nr:hypothetical protein LUTEI9C_100052 [Luteimonas sp. 9C]
MNELLGCADPEPLGLNNQSSCLG